jgi:ATP-dependent helicase HrpB
VSDRPEILESELSGLALDCAAWGADPADLPFLDAPPAGQLAAARALLRDLDALDGEGRITATGRRMARLGTHPRLARMMAAAGNHAEAALAAELAALLEERDPIRGREAPSDIQLRLDLLHGADDPNADRAALARVRRAVTLHRRRLGVPGGTEAGGNAGLLLAAGFPDRIAAKRGVMDGAFRLASGQGARLPPTDKLAKSALLAVADLELAGTEARIRMAAPLDRAVLEARFPERLVREEGAAFDARLGAVVARRRLRLGPLVLEESTIPHADPAAVAAELARASAGRALRDLNWTEAAKQTRARMARMHRLDPEHWPDVSDEALARDGAAWLAPWLSGLSKLSELRGLDVVAMLRAMLPQPRALDTALPTRVDLPGGRSAAIDYDGEVPRLEARAQWLFGMASLPPLAGGRIPLQVALLSPAGRPVAVTADLPGFWRGAWADVRKDMRGRYPRHDWPEDPSRGG